MRIIGDWVLFTSNRALQNSFRSGAPNMIYLHTQGSNLHFSFNWYIILSKNDKAFFIILKRTIKKWKKKHWAFYHALWHIQEDVLYIYVILKWYSVRSTRWMVKLMIFWIDVWRHTLKSLGFKYLGFIIEVT